VAVWRCREFLCPSVAQIRFHLNLVYANKYYNSSLCEAQINNCLVNVLFYSLDLSHGMIFLVTFALLRLRSHSKGSLSPTIYVKN